MRSASSIRSGVEQFHPRPGPGTIVTWCRHRGVKDAGFSAARPVARPRVASRRRAGRVGCRDAREIPIPSRMTIAGIFRGIMSDNYSAPVMTMSEPPKCRVKSLTFSATFLIQVSDRSRILRPDPSADSTECLVFFPYGKS